MAACLRGTTGPLVAPAAVEAEVAGVLRGRQLSGEVPERDVGAAFAAFLDLGIAYVQHRALLERAWAMRQNLTVADGLLVAPAQATRLPLLTTDGRLARAAEAAGGVALAP